LELLRARELATRIRTREAVGRRSTDERSSRPDSPASMNASLTFFAGLAGRVLADVRIVKAYRIARQRRDVELRKGLESGGVFDDAKRWEVGLCGDVRITGGEQPA